MKGRPLGARRKVKATGAVKAAAPGDDGEAGGGFGQKPDRASEDLVAAAFAHLVSQVAATGGAIAGAMQPTADVVRVRARIWARIWARVWATAHGLADLIAARPMQSVAGMTPEERDAFLSGIIAQALPSGPAS